MLGFRKPLVEGDYVLMISNLSSKYMKIGEIIEIEYYPSSDDVLLYRIQFEDGIREYSWDIRDSLKVLAFER